jgi:pyruvate, water dikinase
MLAAMRSACCSTAVDDPYGFATASELPLLRRPQSGPGGGLRQYALQYRTDGSGARGSVVWLGEPAAHDAALVGPKAANLSRLLGTYRVPIGFCLTASAMDRSMADIGRETARAYAALAQLSGEAAPPVAVRSSATDEDGGAASFAGVHDTFLNARGAEAVLQSVRHCRQSMQSPRALEYRRQRGLALDGVRLAVLVQRLVHAEASAVVFSANPITRSRHQVVLTSTWGLGESLVGGTVSPDSYFLRKSDLTMERRLIATKRRMTIPAADGTREVDVPSDLQARPAIADAQVREAARLAIDLAQTFGWPVDVECAWENNVLYVLQCRPTTTL